MVRIRAARSSSGRIEWQTPNRMGQPGRRAGVAASVPHAYPAVGEKMRIAILSDIHGNRHALEAVLADARREGASEYWVLGDFCAIGPEPVAVLEQVARLEGLRVTRGNTDRYVVSGDRPPPDLATVRERPELIQTYADIAASFAWTRGYVTARGWIEWLERLPLEIRLKAPDDTRILCVHASPGTDDGVGVHAEQSDDEIASLLSGCDADLIFVGHTHRPLVRTVGEHVVVNLGSLSNPRPPDLRASYVLLDLNDSGTRFQHRRVSYDHESFAEAVRRSGHPASEFILMHQRGERGGHVPQIPASSHRFLSR